MLIPFHMKMSCHVHASYERISTRTRFEKETKGNSEIAYCNNTINLCMRSVCLGAVFCLCICFVSEKKKRKSLASG